jgi:hypothetical protein
MVNTLPALTLATSASTGGSATRTTETTAGDLSPPTRTCLTSVDSVNVVGELVALQPPADDGDDQAADDDDSPGGVARAGDQWWMLLAGVVVAGVEPAVGGLASRRTGCDPQPRGRPARAVPATC